MKRLYFDTEFTGLHQKTTLISLGLVSDTDDFFYAEFTDYDKNQVNDWIQQNVLANLLFAERELGRIFSYEKQGTYVKGPSNEIREELEAWIKKINPDLNKMEIWSDCLAYDWVLFNNLWGSAFDIPSVFYYIPMDLSTALRIKGIDPDISREEFVDGFDGFRYSMKFNSSALQKHNALWDAFIIKACVQKLEIEELA